MFLFPYVSFIALAESAGVAGVWKLAAGCGRMWGSWASGSCGRGGSWRSSLEGFYDARSQELTDGRGAYLSCCLIPCSVVVWFVTAGLAASAPGGGASRRHAGDPSWPGMRRCALRCGGSPGRYAASAPAAGPWHC